VDSPGEIYKALEETSENSTRPPEKTAENSRKAQETSKKLQETSKKASCFPSKISKEKPAVRTEP
jgi:hypothetical protein